MCTSVRTRGLHKECRHLSTTLLGVPTNWVKNSENDKDYIPRVSMATSGMKILAVASSSFPSATPTHHHLCIRRTTLDFVT